MSESNKAVVRRYFEKMNNRDTSSLAEVVAQGVDFHGMEVHSLDELRAKVDEIVDAIPDFQITVEELIAEGDRVVARTIERGTQIGEFEGMPATGRSFELTEANIFRLESGKIAEVWQIADHLALLMQLGLFPQPEAAL